MEIDPKRIEVIDDRVAAILRAMPVIEKVRLAEAMMLEARDSLRHIVHREHSAWSDGQIDVELANRWGGRSR
jgi:hypothetical protein